MSDETKGPGNGNGTGGNSLTIKGHALPFKQDHRTNPHEIRDGATALRRAYYSNGISRRTRTGKMISQLEHEFAEHRGYPSLSQMPVTQRLKVQLLIGNLLYIAAAEPAPNSKIGLRDVHCSQNCINRLLTELGLERAKKPALDLHDYLRAKHGEQAC